MSKFYQLTREEQKIVDWNISNALFGTKLEHDDWVKKYGDTDKREFRVAVAAVLNRWDAIIKRDTLGGPPVDKIDPAMEKEVRDYIDNARERYSDKSSQDGWRQAKQNFTLSLESGETSGDFLKNSGPTSVDQFRNINAMPDGHEHDGTNPNLALPNIRAAVDSKSPIL